MPNELDLEGLFENLFGKSGVVENIFSPLPHSLTLNKDKTAYEIYLSFPGYKKEDFKITKKDRVLSIVGDNKRWGKNVGALLIESNMNLKSGTFTIADGILHVIIPVKTEEKPLEETFTVS